MVKFINLVDVIIDFKDDTGYNFNLPETTCDYKKLEFPIFSKPKKGSGSRGIKLCYDEKTHNCINC